MCSISRFTVLATLVLFTGYAAANEPATTKQADPLAKAFAKLKALSGDWQVEGVGDSLPKNAKVYYRVTAGGSVVVEKLFAGTKMEMVSMYHRDGKKLVMTHYCVAQNQPRFVGRVDDTTGDLIFTFTGATNLDASKDMYIHGGRIHFVNDNTISSEWEYYVNGQRGGSHKMTLRRLK